MAPQLSFVIPVRNDAVRLETCLKSILRNPQEAHAVEIVVIDNGSSDASADVGRRFGARVLVVENARVSELRNRGARYATGSSLAFVDADNEIGAGWIETVTDILKIEGVGAAGALYQPPADGTWVQRAFALLRGRTRGQGDALWLGSGNLAVARAAFESVDGFDVSLETCEDVDLCNRLRAKGFRIVGDSRIESIHHGDPRTLTALFRAELWRGRDNLRVSFRRPVFWPAIPSALLPLIDLALLGAGLLGLLGWIAGWQPGAWLAVGSLLGIAAAAAIRVLRAAAREKPVGLAEIGRAFIAACVYDVARALALVARAPHRTAHSRTAAAAS